MSSTHLRLLAAGTACWAILSGIAVAGEKKPLSPASAGNDKVEFTATIHTTPEEIQQAFGPGLPAGIVVVQINIKPKAEEVVRIDSDDFTLLSYKDGQRSGAYSPSQIAGSAAMVVTARTTGGGMIAENQRGPTWGGLGGSRPQTLGGSPGIGGGSAGGDTTNQVEMKEDGKENPVLKALKERALPASEGSTPTSGLLYFPLEGKHKLKDLALLYKGSAGRLTIEFSGK